MEKHVLGLALATDPRWVNIAEKNKIFLSLARDYAGPDLAEERWKELLLQESALIRNLEPRFDRLH